MSGETEERVVRPGPHWRPPEANSTPGDHRLFPRLPDGDWYCTGCLWAFGYRVGAERACEVFSTDQRHKSEEGPVTSETFKTLVADIRTRHLQPMPHVRSIEPYTWMQEASRDRGVLLNEVREREEMIDAALAVVRDVPHDRHDASLNGLIVDCAGCIAGRVQEILGEYR